MNWHPLETLEDLDAAVAESHAHPVVIFKHSTRCSVSSMALRYFELEWNDEGPAKAYFLDLIAYRNLSNTIAERFEIRHESPQMIVLKASRPVYHASHSHISAIHPSISEN